MAIQKARYAMHPGEEGEKEQKNTYRRRSRVEVVRPCGIGVRRCQGRDDEAEVLRRREVVL